MDQQTHDLLVKFVYIFLSAALPVLATYAVKFMNKGLQYLDAKVKSAQPDVYAQLDAIVKMGVFAAEQAGINGWAEDKKSFALDLVQKELLARGFNDFDVAQLEAKIEAAVYAEINKDKAQG
jgi:hypothetical protein